ncbi:bifunctional uridylyltransferase/uridylyl-removing protein GlnD [Rodentibacter caecimuris]|uniref:Bifunctional uridylyltransferase/uridylyl-removing enzyme n=1 Tax=Rodentibacter caecimuris TaxID=1796644 RepID=A0ABX3KWC6_9PAST|nr:[protein-PII] uridylyltransferase [Rodentibacter heylii]
MLFSYRPESNLTAKSVKNQHELLKKFELEHFSQYDIFSLIANRTAFFDTFFTHLWEHFQLSQDSLCLVAVGGYGREEMFPLSDLDFLILTECTLSPCQQGKISRLIKFLWDCGFQVGQSVRSLEECLIEGKRDITIATNLLEARYLSGKKILFEDLSKLLNAPDFWNKSDFFAAKIEEKKQRYQRYRNTAYNLEPDIKYNPGGLRDLHLLYWIALRHNGAKNLAQILNSGFIYPEEYLQLKESQAFLFRVRFVLHLILKRADNRLLFDRQIRVSQILGFEGKRNEGVEKMMKQFFQALCTISRMTNLLAQHYQEHFLTPIYDVFIHQLDEDFELVNHGLRLRNPRVLLENADRILDLFFYLTQFEKAELHSSTLRQLDLALKQLNGKLSESEIAREKFLRLFNQPNAVRRAFLPMHQYGVLTAYLSQWECIEGLMQFDLFHIYTVDEHTLRVMLKLESFLTEESAEHYPICHHLFSRFSDRTLLYIAALFHDIAKGRGGDHAQLGALDVIQFARLHSFDQREIETMRWLVESHLLMSITAQRRDIHDPEVVLSFAEQVQNQVRLDYLTCLTVADICATNETLWNSWKRSLFTELYHYTRRQFLQGMEQHLDNREKIEENRRQAFKILNQSQLGLTETQIILLWNDFPEAYFARNFPQQIAWHTGLIARFNGQILVKISNRFTQGGTEVFVYCQDKANLFNKIVSTIGAKKCSIHDAQIFTSENGYVFDSFIITETDGRLLQFERRRELEKVLSRILLDDKIPILSVIQKRQLRHFSVETEVRFLNTDKKAYTGVEIIALDKTGLLAQISQIFADLKLNLRYAKITTVGEKAEDFFILTNKNARALNQQEREKLAKTLYQRLGR